MEKHQCFVGTAGWGIPSRYKDLFPRSGAHLERYSGRLAGVEINSSFYKPHRRETYERWTHSVPEDFRFCVKVPRTVTHKHRLADCEDLIEAFLGQAGGLGRKLAVLLVQLPPSLSFEPRVTEEFFGLLRKQTGSKIACEPRHASWFEQDADALLTGFRVARVAADPARVPAAATPSGWPGLVYFRLHGAPRIYYSDYDTDSLIAIRQRLDAASAAGAEAWCIFDNTVKGHALGNALAVDAMAPQITFSSRNARPSATRVYPNAAQSTVR
ncbi:MAG: DUF72 domain-containing protein [Mesorhizobium sp.]|nr:DUF72 domain-containing protein [Mesorhizobium sp.]RWB26471.1 MAG: DUF72 domain-containing protein [Mesorhizobium sp.]RWB35038.1 MAG: DUF72 domain-containing protein [Mesorhizobium sp.]RWB78218.1 MAG: DUF72 domain-containing protein [Mesorhizobium sp.]RWC26603.1 MAG: DUF72 domain-containing protein [Mesorhizobium sp.]RWD31429.1 MAG: DUF72 domain-containing protein [Mesorhizobium sp.]